MSNGDGNSISRCVVKIVGGMGAPFLAISQAVDNLVTHLFGPGAFWLIAGPLLAGLWTYEYFCVGSGDDA